MWGDWLGMNNGFDEQVKYQSDFIKSISPQPHWSRGVFITMEVPNLLVCTVCPMFMFLA